MRYIEIKGGIRVPLTHEEARIVKMVEVEGSVASKNLDERDLNVAHQMASKGILEKKEEDEGGYTFTVNRLESIWRD